MRFVRVPRLVVFIGALAAVFAILLAAPRAFAQDDMTDAIARQHKVAGDNAMNALNYEGALKEYDAAAALEPHPLLLYNRARAFQALGRMPEALEYFQAFAREAPPTLLARVRGLDDVIDRLRGQVGELEIVCNISGATVLVRAVKVGTAPLKPRAFTAGPATISVLADGYRAEDRNIVIAPRTRQTVRIDLVPADERGLLKVRSSVDGATVIIDGKPVGASPTETALQPGPHTVQIEHPDYKPLETRVELQPREKRSIDLTLEKRPGIFSQWWFWTAAGAVVVGGVVLGVALATERSPSAGTIPPGTISAPLTF
jgi:hypothetical protein